MRSTHWLRCAGVLGLLLGSAGQYALKADESAEARAIRLVEDAGGIVSRGGGADQPVVAVSLCGAKLNDDIVRSLAAFPSLKSLDLCHTDGLTSKRVRFLADLKSLETLNVSRCPDITGHGMYKLAALKNLRSLNVANCPEIDDCGLEAIVEFFPKLRSLDISGAKHVTARGLKELANLCLLETLTAANCDFSDAEIQAISKITTLSNLSVASSNRATVNGLKTLASLTELETLDMSGSQAVTSASLYGLSKLPKLHTLTIANCPRMANHSLNVLRNLKSLHTLNLSGCTQLENYGLEYLVKSLPNLRAVDLSGCVDINDDGIKTLVKLGQLETLDLRGCKNVSAAGAKALSDAMPKVALCR